MKQVFNKIKQNWMIPRLLINSKREETKQDKISFSVFNKEHNLILAFYIGFLIAAFSYFFSLLGEGFFTNLMGSGDTPMALFPYVVIEELAKFFGIYLLISIREKTSGLSVFIVPTTFGVLELILNWFTSGIDPWRFIPLFMHIFSAIVYLHLLQISKKWLPIAFIISLLFHWAWNIQFAVDELLVSDTVFNLLFYGFWIYIFYVFKTLRWTPDKKW